MAKLPGAQPSASTVAPSKLFLCDAGGKTPLGSHLAHNIKLNVIAEEKSNLDLILASSKTWGGSPARPCKAQEKKPRKSAPPLFKIQQFLEESSFSSWIPSAPCNPNPSPDRCAES